MDLWMAVRTQWRAGGIGIIGLDYGEVRRSALDIGITMTAGMWEKIKTLERYTLEKMHVSDDRPRNPEAPKRPRRCR